MAALHLGQHGGQGLRARSRQRRNALGRVIRWVIYPRAHRVGDHRVGRVRRQEGLDGFHITHGGIEPQVVGIGWQDDGRIVDDPRRRSGNSTAVRFSAGRVALSWTGEGVP